MTMSLRMVMSRNGLSCLSFHSISYTVAHLVEDQNIAALDTGGYIGTAEPRYVLG